MYRGSGDGKTLEECRTQLSLVSVDCYLYMDLSELKNSTKHLLTDNELLCSHLFTLQFIYPFVIICFEVFQHEIHGMVPFCKLICYPSIVYGNGDGDGDSCIEGWMGTAICGDGWRRGRSRN